MYRREIDIEVRLTKHLSGSEFERFGNLYLRYHYKNEYPQTKLGLQKGGNSTVAGQPDTFFALPGHKFKFAELTSLKGGLVGKLKKDVEACLNEDNHGIPHEQISHIDLVFAGLIKKPQQLEEIAAPAEKLGITVEYHGLDRLVNAINDDPRLARYLGLPVDTGQILTIDDFIEHHERGRLTIGTPLSNAYLDRSEYNLLTEQLEKSDIVVLQGVPGCGKTKLALEYMQRYLAEKPNSDGYCIIQQPPEIWNDVSLYILDDKDYVILVDDANRQVDNLLALLGNLNKLRRSTHKILITVRGYALNEVTRALRENGYRFTQLHIGLMSNEQIIEVLKSPSFKIRDGIYHSKINRLAKGNVRLAIMMATLARQDGCDISVLSDVSALYDEYYQRAILDQTIWKDTLRLRVLGLIAVFQTVDSTRPTEIEPILEFLEMPISEFWRHIHHLEELEVIEVYQDDAFRFTDQVFATYAFYQCFYNRRALALDTLLASLHDSKGYQIKDAILSVNESFNKGLIRNWVQPVLSRFYHALSGPSPRLSFLLMYSRFLLDEAVSFIYDFVDGRITAGMISSYESNINKDILDLLFEFLAHTDKRTSATDGYELMIALLEGQIVSLEDVSKKIEVYLERSNSYYFIEYDGPRFDQYDWLSAYLVERSLQGSISHCQVMDSSLKHFLMLKYDKPGQPPIYQRRIWDFADNQLSSGCETVRRAIYEYMTVEYGNSNSDIVQADADEIVRLVRKQFSPDNPLDCRNVHGYVTKLNKLPLKHRKYRTLAREFNGELYQIYCTLSFVHLKGRDQHTVDIMGSPTVRKRKVNEIRTALAFENLDELKDQYSKIRTMGSLVLQPGDGWTVSEGLTEYFLSIAERDANLFLNVFKHVVSVGLPEGYEDHPPLMATVMERNYIKPDDLYATILTINEKNASWLLRFFWALPELEINTRWFVRLDSHLPNIALNQPHRIIVPQFLRRYVSFDPSLPSKVFELIQLEAIINKKGWFLGGFIEEFGLDADVSLTGTLEELYLTQYFVDRSFDYKHKALMILLNRRRNFWTEFLTAHYNEKDFLVRDYMPLFAIWSREDYYELVDEGLQLVNQRKVYGIIQSNNIKGFFENVHRTNTEKLNQFIDRFIQENVSETTLLNAIYLALSAFNSTFGDRFIKIFLTYNTSVDDFVQIDWIHSSGVHINAFETITGELNASQWENILVKVESMDNQLKYLRHKEFIKKRIYREKEQADEQRRANFLRRR